MGMLFSMIGFLNFILLHVIGFPVFYVNRIHFLIRMFIQQNVESIQNLYSSPKNG